MIAIKDITGKRISVKYGREIPKNIIILMGGEDAILKSKIGVKTIDDLKKFEKTEADKIKSDQKKTDDMQKKIVSDRQKKNHPVKVELEKQSNDNKDNK